MRRLKLSEVGSLASGLAPANEQRVVALGGGPVLLAPVAPLISLPHVGAKLRFSPRLDFLALDPAQEARRSVQEFGSCLGWC